MTTITWCTKDRPHLLCVKSCTGAIVLDTECAICSCTELTQVATLRLEPLTRRTKLELHGMQMMLSLMAQL